MAPILQTKNLCRQFGSGKNLVNAVKDVSIAIEEGQLTVLRGPSGSGKTTLLNMLSTLDLPTSGQIFYGTEQTDLTTLTSRQRDAFRRRESAIIFQAVALMGEMTAYENVEFGLRIAGVRAGERRRRAQESLTLVGLGKRMTHIPSELSGGEQQRIAIARAIAHQPKIIFADEPTAELDSGTALQVMKVFKDLIREENLSVVMTTHDPNMMEIADRVYTLRDGEIVDE